MQPASTLQIMFVPGIIFTGSEPIIPEIQNIKILSLIYQATISPLIIVMVFQTTLIRNMQSAVTDSLIPIMKSTYDTKNKTFSRKLSSIPLINFHVSERK